MDKMKKYIQENRREMDEAEFVPRDEMWNAISKRGRIGEGGFYSKNKTILLWKRLSIAAGLLALIGWGLWFFNKNESPKSLADTFPEIAKKEMNFQQLIAEKEKDIDLKNVDRAIFQDVLNDLDSLDKSMGQTRDDIFLFPENDRAVETLLRSYELKIRILENLKRQIEKQKYHEEFEKSI